jgi:hypothetical protein
MYWNKVRSNISLLALGSDLTSRSLAYAELYLVLDTVFRRFDLELFDTIREGDVDHSRDYFVGRVLPKSKGVRVKVLRETP